MKKDKTEIIRKDSYYLLIEIETETSTRKYTWKERTNDSWKKNYHKY